MFRDLPLVMVEVELASDGEQALANLVTIGFSFVVTFAILKVLDAVMGIRAPEEDEFSGLDVAQHAETAYNFGEVTMGRG